MSLPSATPDAFIFARYLNQGETRLDALISNACQNELRRKVSTGWLILSIFLLLGLFYQIGQF